MSVTMKITGLREIEKALAQIPAGTAKGVARRALKKELQPVAELANVFWPGSADDVFRVTSSLSRNQPQPTKGRSIVNMFVGAPGGRGGTPEAHLIEFGTGPRAHKSGKYVGAVSPTPMLQPAWDARKGQMLESLGQRLWDEIEKTMARRAKRAAKG
ncbi:MULTISPECIES: hypothetical protein [unclassified Marinovum]|uniref:hypothetical protein n=1 Tax=unclassified Marinovum TaxID=2647166 RepID=UPI003EDC365A